MDIGLYADGREFALPKGWSTVDPQRLHTASNQAYRALGLSGASDVEDRLADYYQAESDYAGTLFLDIEPNDPFEIGPSDLLAVTTLSIDLNARVVRRVLMSKELRSIISHELRALSDLQHPLTDLQPGMLDHMWNLYDALRTVLATEERASVWWVFAAKLCARKRPELFPVRDSIVCSYLADGQRTGRPEGQLGNFSIDIQVFAHLMTDSRVRDRLYELRRDVERRGGRVDSSLLRLLDAVLWTAGKSGV